MPDRPGILDHAAVLAEPTRGRILVVLDRQELAVSELCRALELPQSTASRHLKVLADGGWVRSRREGTSHRYRLAELEGSAASLWALVRDELLEDATAHRDLKRLEDVLRERRERSREFFSATAGDWDRLRDELFGRRFDLMALAGLLDPAWTVGDLGCGTGRVSAALSPFVERVIAVDGSEAMLETARARLAEHANVEVREGDLERLPIADGRLDAATLVLALHLQGEPAAVLAEARRVLAPGGRLLVVDMLPHEREEFREQMGHVWLGFETVEIGDALAAAGFEGVRVLPLPTDSEASGPALFAAVAAAPAGRGEREPDPELVAAAVG